MKLQQLRYAVETFRRNLNVSEAAESLFTSQPGVSKQIRLLEEELGVQIFIRNGKRMVAVTPVGRAILEMAERILHDVHEIKQIKHRFIDDNQGCLNIAITSTLARFRLPESMATFLQQHADVQVNIKQASPENLPTMVLHGEVDFAITSQTPKTAELRRLVCEPWQHALLLPENHILNQQNNLSLNDIITHPLLMHEDMLQADTPFIRTIMRHQIPNYRIALTSHDMNVLQTYVKLGLGIGLVDAMMQSELMAGLVLRDISHLFNPDYVQILLRPDCLLRNYSYDFFQCFYPHFTKEQVDRLLYAPPIDDFSI